MPFSRREFLQQTSSAALAAGIATKLPRKLPSSLTARDIMPDPDEALLKSLALKAMDAAKSAGATFADIRLTAARYFMTGAGAGKPTYPPQMTPPIVGFPMRYGIRAIVDGAWGFAAETAFSEEAIIATARTAVAVARGNKTRRRTHVELAAVPAEQGTWDSPMEKDALDVPMLEIQELALEAVSAVYNIDGIYSGNVNLDWRRPTTVFASTEGSLILQRFSFAHPGGVFYSSTKHGGGTGVLEGVKPGHGGFEAVSAKTIVEEAVKAAHRAVDAAEDSEKRPTIEPGRYDIVMSTGAAAGMIVTTIDTALGADYALGNAMNGAGLSFASPPKDMLGKYQIASPLITLKADRSRPGGAATVGWDTEGVRPEPYTLVDRGVITDYHADREAAAEIGDWRHPGQPARAHGCVRREGTSLPTTLTPNMTLVPSPDSTTEEDLIRDVKKGFYLADAHGYADQQTLSAQYYSLYAKRIVNGKLGEYVKEIAFQILMPQFWKNVDAIGGASSSKTFVTTSDGEADRDPAQSFVLSTFDMVPIRVRKVNVLNIGQTA